jgi:lysophospholipase L1-like esterase
MNRSTPFIRTVALIALLAASTSFVASNPPSNTAARPELRFEQEIQAFAEADRANPPVPGGILFVGSSIFRHWTNVAEMMAPLPVLNRAFGGSRTGEQLSRFDQVVMPYAPKVIVYYCGSNDLNAKPADAPEDIFGRFRAFSERVRAVLPTTRLIYVTATRSPDRVALWEQVDHYNALVRAYCGAPPHHTIIDINPALVDDQRRPRLELYKTDKLHFQPPAYFAFAEIIKPVLTRIWKEAVSSAPKPSAKLLSENPDVQAFLNGQLVPKLGNAWDYMFAPG